MTNKQIIILGFSIILFSCKSPQAKTEKFYTSTIVECNWPNKKVIDTTFEYNFRFSLYTRCLDNMSVLDTLKVAEDTFVIRNFKNIEYIVNSSKFEQKIITKKSLGDSLASDLMEKGIFCPPFQIDFNKQDTSIVLKTFIGFPETDFGDIYLLKIMSDGNLKVIGKENPVYD